MREAFSIATVQAILDTHAAQEGPLLPILHDVQEAFGYVPPDAVPVIADAAIASKRTATTVGGANRQTRGATRGGVSFRSSRPSPPATRMNTGTHARYCTPSHSSTSPATLGPRSAAVTICPAAATTVSAKLPAAALLRNHKSSTQITPATPTDAASSPKDHPTTCIRSTHAGTGTRRSLSSAPVR